METKVMISMPSTGNPSYRTFQSFVALATMHRNHYMYHFVESNAVHRARNQAVYDAVRNRCTHLMFIDDDMTFPHDAVDRLVDRNKDIIGALCYARMDVLNKPVIKRIEGNKILDMTMDEVPTWEEPFKVGVTGTGFLLINMDVFKRIDPPFFYFANPTEFGLEEQPFPGNDIGEDVTFMLKARQAGFKVWVDPTITIGHVGTKVYQKFDYAPVPMEIKRKTAIFIPTVDRVSNLKRLLPNIEEATPEPHQVYVMTKNKDVRELCKNYGVVCFTDETFDIRYTTRINYMYQHTDEPFVFTGADDVIFHKGWLSQAFAEMDKGFSVIGVNDMFNPLGTNFLIRREYIESQSGCIDVKDVIFYPEYKHSFVDTELISVAKIRHQYSKAEASVVEHMHWRNNKGKYDATYKWADDRVKEDMYLFHGRKNKFKFPQL